MRLGALGHPQSDGNGYGADDVQRIMWELWTEYITTADRQLFKG
jgi:hypothetical protein